MYTEKLEPLMKKNLIEKKLTFHNDVSQYYGITNELPYVHHNSLFH